MFLGASVQGTVGFGANMVSAPLLVLVDPGFVPVPVILVAAVLNLLVARRERAVPAGGELVSALAGLVPGSIAGAAVLRLVDGRTLGIVFAAMVLVAVAVVATGVHLRPTRRTLFASGAASGLMGTASSIGGPPIAMVLSRSEGPVVRATLARFFLAAAPLSVASLLVFGQVHARDLALAAVLLPGSLAGYAVSGPAARKLDRGHTRRAVLTLCAVAAIAVVLKEL